MVTKSHLTYDLLGLIQGGSISDDQDLTLRQIGFWIGNTRAQLIRQSLNKGQSISDNIKQTIPCLEMEVRDASECPCDISDCVLLRSKEQLPTFIEIYQQDMLIDVRSTMIGTKPFNIIPYSRVPWVSFSKFGKELTKAYLHNRYLYLITETLYEKVSISGIFQNPEDLGGFMTCEGTPCWTDDSYYPISIHMIEDMKKMIIETNFKTILNTKQLTDNINNAKAGS